MISRISGKIRKQDELCILLDVNGICYDIMVPPAIVESLKENVSENGSIELITYHYYQTEPSKSVPVLIGFANEIEREFFEQFISVSGVGPKAACKALILPFSTIAEAIDKGDVALLKTLPGVGDQRARQIIAKLQNKVGKFGLMQDKHAGKMPIVKNDVKSEAIAVLLQLQYKKKEAEFMIDRAFANNPKVDSCEGLLNEVYKQKGKE